MKLVNADTMRGLDRFTIDTIGIPGVVLMESAGRAVADAVTRISDVEGIRSVLVVCGPGNNGGDGFVAARHMIDAGLDVVVVLLTERNRYSGDALINLKALEHFNAVIEEAPGGIPDETILWAAGAITVDAIFGTGLTRPVTGIYADTIDILNTLQGPAVAVDIPSGIDSDTGAVLGTAFEADVTVTFGAAKIGHYVWPGRGHCGEIRVVPIGIPAALIERTPDIFLMENRHAAMAFQPRPRDSYKNIFGHAAIIGGLPGKTGAAVLAARAAIRSGAGLTTIATCETSAARLEGCFPDIMLETPFSLTAAAGGRGGDTRATSLDDSWIAADQGSVDRCLEDKNSVVVGPGLGQRPGTVELVRFVLGSGIPTVVDADALNVIAANPGLAGMLGPGCILTPHPGEAARLLGIDKATVQNFRVRTATDLASRTGAVVVLKGAGTIVAGPDGRMAISDHGSPSLAVAGSGDVLAGIAGALLARGIPAFDAACAAVTLHGIAGLAAGETIGEYSTTASDLVEMLPRAVSIVCGLTDGGDGDTEDSDA